VRITAARDQDRDYFSTPPGIAHFRRQHTPTRARGPTGSVAAAYEDRLPTRHEVRAVQGAPIHVPKTEWCIAMSVDQTLRSPKPPRGPPIDHQPALPTQTRHYYRLGNARDGDEQFQLFIATVTPSSTRSAIPDNDSTDLRGSNPEIPEGARISVQQHRPAADATPSRFRTLVQRCSPYTSKVVLPY